MSVLDYSVKRTVTLRTEAINDEQRTLTYKALDGDVLKLYPSYQFAIAVSDVKWTIEYEKALPVVPTPEIYMVLALPCVQGEIFGGLKVKNVVSGEVTDLNVYGLFFAIGHESATKFLDEQLEVDSNGYVITKPGTDLVG
ncbi:unnamed protein product [Fraxinus pennsylvanica]|uniref:Bet v I/Major latex protein domain-containing protein n=1 Tax=Fraxinus pennsylvanica TaxID=56036 RepID=A0AAD2A4D8_9LAMI|nr:unnamed protein product [Fraxinus pennsylvanica]